MLSYLDKVVAQLVTSNIDDDDVAQADQGCLTPTLMMLSHKLCVDVVLSNFDDVVVAKVVDDVVCQCCVVKL